MGAIMRPKVQYVTILCSRGEKRTPRGRVRVVRWSQTPIFHTTPAVLPCTYSSNTECVWKRGHFCVNLSLDVLPWTDFTTNATKHSPQQNPHWFSQLTYGESSCWEDLTLRTLHKANTNGKSTLRRNCWNVPFRNPRTHLSTVLFMSKRFEDLATRKSAKMLQFC